MARMYYTTYKSPIYTLRYTKDGVKKTYRAKFISGSYAALSASESPIGIDEWDLIEGNESKGIMPHPRYNQEIFNESNWAKYCTDRLPDSEQRAINNIQREKDAVIAKLMDELAKSKPKSKELPIIKEVGKVEVESISLSNDEDNEFEEVKPEVVIKKKPGRKKGQKNK